MGPAIAEAVFIFEPRALPLGVKTHYRHFLGRGLWDGEVKTRGKETLKVDFFNDYELEGKKTRRNGIVKKVTS